MASLRIINAARSSKAIVSIKLKFGLDVPYEKVKIFGTTVENFVKERPKEWLALLGFRATVVEADLGYIGYIVLLNHVESWQNIGVIKQSLADVSSFCLEVQKMLQMKFVSPPMPVNLSLEENNIMTSGISQSKSADTADVNDGPTLDGIQIIQNLFNRNPTNPSATIEKKEN